MRFSNPLLDLYLLRVIYTAMQLKHFYRGLRNFLENLTEEKNRMAKLLGEFEKLILFALLRLGEDAYGAAIQREIAARTGRDFYIGAVYTALHRLQKRGYISARMGEPTPERGGRRKKYYALQPAGARSLSDAYNYLRRMAEGTESLLEALLESGDV